MATDRAAAREPLRLPIPTVFIVALRLGLTSFGGPIAHIGAFRREYVERRRWIDPASFGELVALCQALPGPASSQLGIAIGTTVAGRLGGVAAWLGFTMPSAIAMLAFALLSRSPGPATAGWVHGLELAAVAIVAVAVVAMARAHAATLGRAGIAALAALATLAAPLPATDVVVVAGGALLGLVPRARRDHDSGTPAAPPLARSAIRGGVVSLAVLGGCLVVLPLIRPFGGQALAIADTFVRTGALAFGGGHVVLPLLDAGTVEPGWVTSTDFVAGYGAAQALPGPLFTFAGYLGAVAGPAPNGIGGGLLALGAIFLPSFLLVFGFLPFWTRLRTRRPVRAALDGASAAAVGLLVAALIRPVATTGLRSWTDVAVAAVAAVAIVGGRVPTVFVVAALALAGAASG